MVEANGATIHPRRPAGSVAVDPGTARNFGREKATGTGRTKNGFVGVRFTKI